MDQFVKNQLINVKVIDLSTKETLFNINTSNYISNEYLVSFWSLNKKPLVISKPHLPHKWYFEIANSIDFDFFLLNIRIPIPISEIESIRVKDVIVLNENNRTCPQDFSTRNKWSKIFWF